MAFNSNLAIFSFFIFVIGMCLTYLTYSQNAKLSSKCVNKNVQIGMNVLLLLSTMMMVIPIVQLVCHWNCQCPQNDLWYRGIVVSLGVLIMTTASIVFSGLKGDCDNKSVKNLMIGLISTGVIILIGIGIVPMMFPFMKDWTDEGDGSDYYLTNRVVDEEI